MTRYTCTKCGQLLEGPGVAGCPECGHRGRIRVREPGPDDEAAQRLRARFPARRRLTEMPRVRPLATWPLLGAFFGGAAIAVLAQAIGYRLTVLGTASSQIHRLFGVSLYTPLLLTSSLLPFPSPWWPSAGRERWCP